MKFGVASNGIKFTPNFMKMRHLVQKWEGKNKQYGDLISLLFLLKKVISRLKELIILTVNSKKTLSF
jgi:hypothetical protein